VLIENEIRNLSFCLLLWNFIEEVVAQETPGKKGLLV